MFMLRTAFLRSSSVTPASGPPLEFLAILRAKAERAASSPPTQASAERSTSRNCDSSSRPIPASSKSVNADCNPASCSLVSSRGFHADLIRRLRFVACANASTLS